MTVIPAFEVRALPRVHTPPTPLKVTPPVKTVPLVVIVLPVVVALNVTVPVAFQTVPAIRDIDPETASVAPAPPNVTVPAETVISRHVDAPDIVTVYVPA